MRHTLSFAIFLLVFPCLLLCQKPQLSATEIEVAGGQSVSISADRPVSFRVLGGGSVSSTKGTSTVYTAPTNFGAGNVMAGCMMMPSDSIYNTPAAALPVNPQSSAWTSYLGFTSVTPHLAWGINVVDHTAPIAAQTFSQTTQLNGADFPSPPSDEVRRENGALAGDHGVSHRMIVINRETCHVYETNQSGMAQPGCAACTAESGWTYKSSSYAQPPAGQGGGSADESGLPLAPLTLHLSELKVGYIGHALRLEADPSSIGAGFLWPASAQVGSIPGAPPVGARFRLKANFDVAPYSGPVRTVLNALKEFGMVLGGTGVSGGISTATDVSTDIAVYQALQSLGSTGIAANDFEAVDESSLMTTPSTNQVRANRYVEPKYATGLLVTDLANPNNTETVPISLVPITVGTIDTRLVIQAGTPAIQLPGWVNGSSDTKVTWTLLSTGIGSVTPAGLYTPPSTVNGPTNVSFKVSAPGTAAAAYLFGTIIPSGIIRMQAGSNTSLQDGGNLTWLPNLALQAGEFTQIQDPGSWGPAYNSSVFRSYLHTSGDDISYQMYIPNGSYLVQMMFGVGECSGTIPTPAGLSPGFAWGPLTIQSQGVTPLKAWDFGSPINHACRTGVIVNFPAQVTNSILHLAVRSNATDAWHSVPLLTGLTITPVATSAATASTSVVTVSNTGQPGTVQLSLTDFDSACGTAGHNCRDAFQAAFSVLAQDNGGTVHLPAGTFLLDFPEVESNVAATAFPARSSLIVVPANTYVSGHVAANGTPDSVINWSMTSMPVFVFAKSNGSGLSNLHLTFTGVSPSRFPFYEIVLTRNLGYNPPVVRANYFGPGNYELSSFVYLFDSEFCKFSNLIFDSATHDNNHVFAFGFNFKGKNLFMSGPLSGISAPARGNSITNVKFYDFDMGMLMAGQDSLTISNITADRRGANPAVAPGHVLYTTMTPQWDGSGNVVNYLRNSNFLVNGITEGPDTYSNSVSLGTLAIKCLSGGTISNITSQHPEGLLQTISGVQNVTFKNLRWSSDSVLCDQAPQNCLTPVINSSNGSSPLLPISDLTFENVSLTSTRRSITSNLLGNHLTINGISISTPPVFVAGQTNTNSVLGVADTNSATITGYSYTPLLTAYGPNTPYNVPFEAWNPSSNVTLDMTIHWPGNLPTPATGKNVISPRFQNGSNNATNNIVKNLAIVAN